MAICSTIYSFLATKLYGKSIMADPFFFNILYIGAKADINKNNKAFGFSSNVVMTLIKPYLETGHTLITDNWYTSPRLYNFLYQHKTNAYGTVRGNRVHMPKMEDNLKKGELSCRSTNNLCAIKWQDKKDVLILSPVHSEDLVKTIKKDYRTGLFKQKTFCVQDYNSNMDAIDRVDMILSVLNSVIKALNGTKNSSFIY